jgi:hypothetical protein
MTYSSRWVGVSVLAVALVVGCGGSQGSQASTPRPAVANPTAFPPWTQPDTRAVFTELSIDLDGVPGQSRPDVESFRQPHLDLAEAMFDTQTVEQFVPAEDGSSRGILVLTHVRRYEYLAGDTIYTYQDVHLSLTVEVRVYDLRDVERESRFDGLRQTTVPVLHTGEAPTIAQATFDLSIDVYQPNENRAEVWRSDIATEVARQILVHSAPALQEGAEASRQPRDVAANPLEPAPN